MGGTQAVDQVAEAQVPDQVTGTQELDHVAGTQVLDHVAGTQAVDQVAEAQVPDQVTGIQVVDQVAGTQVVDQVDGVEVVVDQVAGVQVVNQVAGTQGGGSSGRSREDGCSDPGVIQTDIGLVCDISTLSHNGKVELLLNPFTPGDGYKFAHQAAQKGTKSWKVSNGRG